VNLLGKKGKEWKNAREYLKTVFQKMGILYCEARFRTCRVYPDGFAHVLRRRHFGKWDTEEREANIKDVALLCNACHDYIDVVLGEVRGGQELRKIIDRRKGKPSMFADLQDG
jgi:hypothetical protein